MERYQNFIQKIESSGKIKRFEVYKELFRECYKNRDNNIYTFFEDYLELLGEYYNFNPEPDDIIGKSISESFAIIFNFVFHTKNQESFNRYYKFYEKYKILLTDNLSKAKMYQNFGYFFWLKQDNDKAIYYLSQSLELINKTGIIDEIPTRYTNLGFIYESMGQYKKAEYYYLEGLKFAKENNYLEALKYAYDAMGRLNLSLKKYSNAVDYFKESLRLYKGKKSLGRVAVMCNIGSAYIKMKENKLASKFLNEINKKWVKESDPELYYSILSSLAVNYMDLNRYKDAEELLNQTIDFAKQNNAIELLIRDYINLSVVKIKTDKQGEALSILKKTLKLSDETKNINSLKVVYRKMGDIYFEQNHITKAINFYKKSLKFAKSQKNKPDIYNLLYKISKCYEKNRDFEQALQYHRNFCKVKEEFDKESKQKEKELSENALVGIGKNIQYIFKDSENSLISLELSKKIGANFVGRDTKMMHVVKQAILAAGSNLNVLILGESGTGKEIIAKIIHYSSARAKHPFIAVNSAAFASGLAQSTLFGHHKGAFTGASSRQIGYFEAANKGTLFFDEIGDMPLEIQSVLLRVIEEKSIKPLGSEKPVKINFRLISATNKDLYALLGEQKFRLDFLNRINTLEIHIPPLRERKDDIPLLIGIFMNDICSRLNIPIPKITSAALKMLYNYDYPGNIRELKNIIESLIIFNKGEKITPDDIYLIHNKENEIKNEAPKRVTLNLRTLEKEAILEALKKAGNVKVEAAKLLGITPYALLRRLKKYNINV